MSLLDQSDLHHRPKRAWQRSVRLVILVALCLIIFSVSLESVVARNVLIGAAALLVIGLGVLAVNAGLCVQRQRRLVQSIKPIIALNEAAKFITDRHGRVFYRNQTAEAQGEPQDQFQTVLAQRFAQSDALFQTLLSAIQTEPYASQDMVTRRGYTHIKLTRLSSNLLLWSLRDKDHADASPSPGRRVPVITLGRNNTILFMNPAARALLGDRKHCLTDIVVGRKPRFDEINTLRTENGLVTCFLKRNHSDDARQEIFLIPASENARDSSGLTFEDLPVALLKISRSGDVLLANAAARKLMKLTDGANVNLSDIFEGLGRPLADWLSEATDAQLTNGSEFLRVKREDQEVFVQVALGLVPGDDDKALFAVVNDATEQKTLEAQFVQSQKMQAIGQLAGGVAHDFNNLLTAISGHCDLLLLRHSEEDPDFADLTQVAQNANRAAGLVGKLLAFSRKQPQLLETVDLRDLISDLGYLLNRLVGEKYQLDVINEQTLDYVQIDKQQFEQVMVNLIVNARDAMNEGGKIVIRTENAVFDRAYQREKVTIPPGRYVSISVKDQGTGIDETRRDKVFEPFFTTKKTGEGTGLGLSTAYGIVKQSGGYIFLDSTLGKGTTFTIFFPAVKHAPLPSVAQDDAQSVMAGPVERSSILLVEDEAAVRSFAARALRLKGHTVLEAESGKAALTVLKDPGQHISLIISDVIMPDMDGPTWVEHARTLRPSIPVIFVSGYSEESFGEQGRFQLENTTFLAKPFSLQKLNEVVALQARKSKRYS